MNIERFAPFLFRAIGSILCGIVIVFYMYFLINTYQGINKNQQIPFEIFQIVFQNKWLLVGITFFIGEFFICIWEIFVLNTLFGIMILDEKGSKESTETILKNWFLFICSIPIFGWLISIFFFLCTYFFYLPVKDLKKFSEKLLWCCILDKEKIIKNSLHLSIRDMLQIETKRYFISSIFSELYYNFHRFWTGICCFFGSIPVIWILIQLGFFKRLFFFDLFFIIIPSIIYFPSFYLSIEYRIWSNLRILEAKEMIKNLEVNKEKKIVAKK